MKVGRPFLPLKLMSWQSPFTDQKKTGSGQSFTIKFGENLVKIGPVDPDTIGFEGIIKELECAH